MEVKDVLVEFRKKGSPALELAFSQANPDWNRVTSYLGLQILADMDPIQCAKKTFEQMLEQGCVLFQLTRAQEEKFDFKIAFFRVDKNAKEQVESVIGDSYNYGGGYARDAAYRVKDGADLSADLFCVQDEDKGLFEKISDAKVFEETWKKKYGSISRK